MMAGKKLSNRRPSSITKGGGLLVFTDLKGIVMNLTQTKVIPRSLYDPCFEHDSCGVGFIADVSGRAHRRILDMALGALGRLNHRGAIDADGKTGDGAGVLTQIPRKFFLKNIELLGHNLPRPEDLAVGTLFFPREDSQVVGKCREIVEGALERRRLFNFGWRRVPVNEGSLGAKAAATAPHIEQVLIGRNLISPEEYERALYLVRKEIEQEAEGINGFYIPSFSSQTIVYKGLLAATQLKDFYADLNDPDFETALAVFHQRYSTNTFPNWSLAQPFRLLAHNGEINTIAGNRNWMRARAGTFGKGFWGEQYEKIEPLIWAKGSDSASLDNTLEFMTLSGRDPLHAMMMLVPEAYEENTDIDSEVRGFYEYAACLTEPWDGPAALAFSDGRFVGASLDRNGLRPARFTITSDGVIVLASEAGAVDLPAEAIVEKGRLGPGEIIAVDTAKGMLLRNRQIKSEVAERKPYADWVRNEMIDCNIGYEFDPAKLFDTAELIARMKIFGYTLEDAQRIIEPMFEEGKEPIGSMGDDTPLAALSAKPRLLYNFFRQRFAQVTNPAIDSLRERAVMSLQTLIGERGNFVEETASHARLIRLRSPFLTQRELDWMRDDKNHGMTSVTLDALFGLDGEESLKPALEALCRQAVEAIRRGASILILSDRGAGRKQVPVPMLLAVGTVHHHLVREGIRLKASLVVESAEAREDHHFACLIGYGASAVSPYLALEVVATEAERREMSVAAALDNYKSAVEKGLLKIMAKMGISTVAGYAGAQIFEALGLDQELVNRYFTGTSSRIGGLGLGEIARDALQLHQSAFDASREPQLEDAGFYRYRSGGEYHAYNPAVFRSLHKVVRNKDGKDYEEYRRQVESRPPTALRDMLDFRSGSSVPLDEVEAVENIVRRFSTSGMSLGALSTEAHETLAIALNRLGAKSNSGEGGENPARYRLRENGERANSRIKQVASARFGVTPAYLCSADELEIKISQGSKPGEGGQLPGHKVTPEIAALRHSVTGVTLISPPPHHDIYSIEDLAQLIYDLKQINPLARIAVKLVSEAGIGTIAAGVAKAQADVIHISGHDGGTGASPLGSIKNAGSPWEIGLAETQQTLVLNRLRNRVSLRVDGGFKTGRDVVMAAMLGAEEFGFGTAALVALGCVMARQCHMNNCPVGIATQSRRLRERFAGKPEMVEGYFISVAEQVRRILSSLGFRSLGEIIGQSNLLEEKSNVKTARGTQFDLQPLIAQADPSAESKRFYFERRIIAPELSLNARIVRDAGNAVEQAEPVRLSYRIKNTDRAVGASLAGKIARRHGDRGLPEGSFDLTFYGSAGQSFGAFAISGMKISLFGEANDYVAKGMSGGIIAIRPSDRARFNWSENVIAGNTVMYGATGGSLFVAGRAGERFCVRNSGGTAVVEGLGDHGCEYMTAGTVVVLGDTGRNFAAGMTGGIAYVLDVDRRFESVCNTELVHLEPLGDEEDITALRALVTKHHLLTDSPRARDVLLRWKRYMPRFWKVITQGAQAGWETDQSLVAGLSRTPHIESEATLTTELDSLESSLSGEHAATVA